MKRDILLAFTLCIGLSVFGQDSPIKSVDLFIHEMMDKYSIPGLGLVVVKDGKSIKQKSYGLASIEFSIAATDETVFQLASSTKIFTATLVMRLVEDGVLRLTDPITKYIDGLPKECAEIQISHLLSHTHGLRNHFMTETWNKLSDEEKDGLTAADLVRVSAKSPLEFAPLEKFSYSVTGYVALAAIIEKATGKRIDQVMKEKILDPFGMTRTYHGDHRKVIQGRNANQYTYQRGQLENWPFQYGTDINATSLTAAGLNLTIGDLANFFSALDEGKIISKTSIEKMTQPTQLRGGKISSYGSGWSLYEVNGYDKVVPGHEGGSCSWIYYVKEHNLLIGILTNLTASRADEIIDELTLHYIKN